jgi:hypothetical protein
MVIDAFPVRPLPNGLGDVDLVGGAVEGGELVLRADRPSAPGLAVFGDVVDDDDGGPGGGGPAG